MNLEGIFSIGNCSNQQHTIYKSQFVGLDDEPYSIKCMLCDDIYTLPAGEQELLTHLFKIHRLVIGDVWKIASLKSYIHYWGIKFKEEPLTNYCTTLLMDCTTDGKTSKNEKYFLLSDCILEDKTLRDEIHRAKLEWVLLQQSKERIDTNFKCGCMFCRMEFSGSRIEYIKHLSQKHNLHLGKPENLVFLDEFLNKIQGTVARLICIYCEKVFKDRVALKEHMRKKLHKRINPNNKAYDKFYINNYLEPGRTWKQKQSEIRDNEETGNTSSGNEDEEASWSDWNDESIGITCLLCSYSNINFSTILSHMKERHNFDFEEISKNLSFYQKVKIVNYMRKQIYFHRCILCDMVTDNVLEHMEQQDHCEVPKQRIWDQPEFYFPMYENDPFLYNLDASSNSDVETDEKDSRGKELCMCDSFQDNLKIND